ncbi:SusC/RagA family TonB-linked outer membrane protein [Parapedobacter sp. 10938]|uniref:SusC/RagA family TonB-linked outer membrane protein n=1 Tax=Parapedobacter flavus TaxID=3110225 RepID=UPI002DBBA9A9|nr:SusC/RagA family TonB-linked outer membrane protein [Parapedobacter sp. 10938]MEC3878135.1 SusC/RagA family TonB-linked outer membrane protein [Parapedobacter sp. 10938]
MKLTTFLIFWCCLHLSAASLSQTVTLKADKQPLPQVLAAIKQQTGYLIMYNDRFVRQDMVVSVDAKDKPLEDVLNHVLNPLKLTYHIEGNTIAVKKMKVSPPTRRTILPTVVEAPTTQQRVVSGRVIDEAGNALEGVTVSLKGTSSVVTTDGNGTYQISISEEPNTLVFSIVGFESSEFAIGDQRIVNVAMKASISDLDEVVVVGYGTQKKVNLTGAVTQLDGEELKDRPVSNITQALQGTIPNLNIVIGSGQPGTSGTLNIRGNTSITSSGEPLVLIDGVPGEIDRVNVRDVESITVLKDASASAIYGARAAFGVILITTKRAKAGDMMLSYNNNFGWTTHGTNTDFLTSAYDHIRLNEESYYNALGRYWTGYTEEDYEEIYARRNDKVEHPDRPWVMIKPDRSGRDVYKYYGNFDWFNWFFSEWRPKQEHNLSITGSSEKVRYYLSGSLKNEVGLMKQNPDSYRRYNFNGKVDVDLFPWFTVSNNTRFFNSNYRYYGKEGGMFPTTYNNLSTNQT